MPISSGTILINDSSNKTIVGVQLYDRDNGGVLVVPAGATFPAAPVAGELFWRTDEVKLYRRDSTNTAWETSTAASTVPTTRNLTAGAGLTGGGDLSVDRTFDVVANADASIIVNANDIQVGVLASDSQHGVRGGGTQHANVVAAGASGFMTGTDKSKLDGLPSSAVPTARNLTAGAGLTGGGDLSADRTFDVVANVDGSITVNANDIQVGVLASDAQHGVRGGGTQHSNVVAAGASGFMTGSDKSKLDGLPTSAVPTTRNLTAGAGLTGGGDLSADRTFDVVANADGSIVVNANDIQVGVLASDAQHGARGGGTQHSAATTTVPGFLSAADKTKLDGLPTSAVPTTRNLTAGAGLTGGGDLSADRTFDVAANADGSIVVNANDIQVGVLASDAQHGARGGATQHSAVTTTVNGFMLASDKVKLDAFPASSVPTTRNLTAGAGLTGGGDLSADRTFNVVANADGSLVVNADDVQVGVLATDAQHGARGGGTQHSNVVAGGAAGFMTGTDKTKLDGLPTSAVPTTRAVNTTNGLTGGGALSADLTLSPTYGSAANTVCQGNDARLSDDRTASGLRTASTVVSISGATAPTAGQILVATSSTAATWQTVAGTTNPTSGRAVGTTSGPTTTSATFATLAEMSVTVTTTGGNLLINFAGNFNVLRNDDARLQVFVDGTALGPEYTLTNANNDIGIFMAAINELKTGLAAGSHTVTLQWRRVGGTARAYLVNRTLIVSEVL